MVEGYRLLSEGLNWIETAGEGQPWGGSLVDSYRDALARYAERHGGKLVE